MTIAAAVTATSITHGLLIDLTVNGNSFYIANTYSPIVYNGNTYSAVGHFLGITDIQNDLRATNNSLTVSLSGIPSQGGETEPNWVSAVLGSKIKGSRIAIRRVFFDQNTLAILPGQVYLRFKGYVSNFSLADSIDSATLIGTTSVSLQCSNINAVIEKRLGGRRTNKEEQRRRYPNDTSMDRVRVISNKPFDFGKPYVAPVDPNAPPDNGYDPFNGGGSPG
jgi:hypothetical protein